MSEGGRGGRGVNGLGWLGWLGFEWDFEILRGYGMRDFNLFPHHVDEWMDGWMDR